VFTLSDRASALSTRSMIAPRTTRISLVVLKVGCLDAMLTTTPVSFARPSTLYAPPSFLINRQSVHDANPLPATAPPNLKVRTLGHGLSTSPKCNIVDLL
jgi:hypothetical protein